MNNRKKVLHVGCGNYHPLNLHEAFRNDEWQELRLDIDPEVKPDIVASMTDMSVVKTGSVDAIWSSHNLEHLYPHEVPVALAEFCRVLNEDGFALMTLPDLQRVAALIAEDKLDEPAYVSSMGPITPLDMVYGHREEMKKGKLFMAHRTGFTKKTLANALVSAGFAQAKVKSEGYSLWAVAYKKPPQAEPKNS